MNKTVELPVSHRINMRKFLVEIMNIESLSKAKRLISQGAVEVQGIKATTEMVISDGDVVRCGRAWVRVSLPREKFTFDVKGDEAALVGVEE